MSHQDFTVDGAVVTYSLLFDTTTGQFVQQGEFPHCPMVTTASEQCSAVMTVWDMSGSEDARCTRESGHHGSHVVHERPGLPLLAWLER